MSRQKLFYERLEKVFYTIFNVGLAEERDDAILQKLLTLLNDEPNNATSIGEHQSLKCNDKKAIVEETHLLKYLRQGVREDVCAFALQLVRGLASEVVARDPELPLLLAPTFSADPAVRCAALECLTSLVAVQPDALLASGWLERGVSSLQDPSFYVQRAAVGFVSACLAAGLDQGLAARLVGLLEGGSRQGALDCLLQAPPGALSLSRPLVARVIEGCQSVANSSFWTKLSSLIVKFAEWDPEPLLDDHVRVPMLVLCLASALLAQSGRRDRDKLMDILVYPVAMATETTAGLDVLATFSFSHPALLLLSLRLLPTVPHTEGLEDRWMPRLGVFLRRPGTPAKHLVATLELLAKMVEQGLEPEWTSAVAGVLEELLSSPGLEERVHMKVLSVLRLLVIRSPLPPTLTPRLLHLLTDCSWNLKDSCLDLLTDLVQAQQAPNPQFTAWLQPFARLALEILQDTSSKSFVRIAALKLTTAVFSTFPDTLSVAMETTSLRETMLDQLLEIALKDETTLVRRAAAHAIHQGLDSDTLTPSPALREAVESTLRRELDWEVKVNVLRMVPTLRREAERSRLEAAVKLAARSDPDPQVKLLAQGLCGSGEPITADLYAWHPEALLDDILSAAELCPSNGKDCYPE